MSSVIPRRDGVYLLLAACIGDEPPSSFIEIRPLRPEGVQRFFTVRELWAAVDATEALQGHHELVTFGAAPRVRQSGRKDAVERVWALRVDLDDPACADRLRGFRPSPSIVARSKTAGHFHGYWQMRRPLSPELARRAMLRLAHALGSDPSVADPPRVMRVPTEFVRLELTAFTAGDVVRQLPDHPKTTRPPRRLRVVVNNESAALEGLVRVVREAPNHERNNRLNWSAHKAGLHAAEGVLDLERARESLLAAALDVGLPEHEALATIDSGFYGGAR